MLLYPEMKKRLNRMFQRKVQPEKDKQRSSGSGSTNITAATTNAFVNSNVDVQNSIEIKSKTNKFE